MLYVARDAPENGHSESRPCYHCFQKIREFGVKKIVYTTKSGTIEACKTNDYFGGQLTRVRKSYSCN